MNKVILIGNVGKDPEIKEINSTQVAKFSLATTETYKDQQGERKKFTEWHNIECWGNMVPVVEKWVKKGSKLMIEGKIKTASYEKDGEKKNITTIRMEGMEMLGAAIVKEETDDMPF